MNNQQTDVVIIEKKYGADMLRRFGIFYLLSGVGILLRRLRMDDRSADNIRRASETGPLVYVLYARSKLDWLALNRTLNMRRLPLASFTWGLRSLWFRPFFDGAREMWGTIKQLLFGKKTDKKFLFESISNGDPVAIFLVNTKSLGTEPTGVLKELSLIQDKFDKSIQLVPVTVVWNRRPEKLRSETSRFLLGAQDEPKMFQKLFYVISRDHKPIIQAGEPVDLRLLFERNKNDSFERKVRVARLLLRRYLYRESHVIRGPRIRPHWWMRRMVMDSHEIKDLIKSEAKRTNKSELRIAKMVEKEINHIAARFSFLMIRLVAGCCKLIFNRIYSGVDIREIDLQRLQDTIRDGSPVWIPSHRSHLDYLLISSQCYFSGQVLPHIVAGENLSFWPMGAIFRRCGAFFIRRSFKKETIFPAVFKRYLRQLMRDEFPIEFFIEGGRSRTGKLLPPKFGVLTMVLDSVDFVRADKDVQLLPIAVSYEQIAEEKSYARELSGEKKQKESIQGLLRASRVLWKRFGKVYIRVGEPISLRKTFSQLEAKWSELSAERRFEVTQELAERVMYGIGQNMLILPTAITSLALLTTSNRGMRLLEIKERANRFDALLRHLGAMSADSLSHGGWVVRQALERFLSEKRIRTLVDDQEEIIQIHEDHRVTLEYYKNSLIHFVAPVSMLASAILANDNHCHDNDTLRLFQFQAFLFRYEFPTNPNLSMEESAQKSREDMVRYGALAKSEDGTFSVANRDFLIELSSITQNFIESYLLTLKGCQSFRSRDISQKDLPTKIQEFGKARLAINELKRPESLSVANLKNALRAFREEGVLQIRVDGSGIAFDEEAHAAYTDDLNLLLL